jgi:hypothetical protein
LHCKSCINFTCPLNAVDIKTREEFLHNNHWPELPDSIAQAREILIVLAAPDGNKTLTLSQADISDGFNYHLKRDWFW